MPRIALACLWLVAGCSFDADYRDVTYLCEGSTCPPGFVCDASRAPAVCIDERRDAAVDVPSDVMPDARQPLLICGDEGRLPTVPNEVVGTTATRSNTLQPTCAGSGMFGKDAVYRLDVPGGTQVTLSFSSDTFANAAAYIVQPCVGTMGCVGNTYASVGSPATITVLGGNPAFILVDSTIALGMGSYKLTVVP